MSLFIGEQIRSTLCMRISMKCMRVIARALSRRGHSHKLTSNAMSLLPGYVIHHAHDPRDVRFLEDVYRSDFNGESLYLLSTVNGFWTLNGPLQYSYFSSIEQAVQLSTGVWIDTIDKLNKDGQWITRNL